MPAKEFVNSCVSCKDAEASATIRGRPLCQPCFLKYAGAKIHRSMTKFRPQKDLPPTKLLVALSLGTSSSALLHFLHKLRDSQSSTFIGRAGFDLHVLVIDPSSVFTDVPPVKANFDAVNENYPGHEYSLVPLHSILSIDEDIKTTLRDFGFVDDESKSEKERLDSFRQSISTATARTDIDNLLLIRLVVTCAKKYGCEGVVWGDSDSRLAAKTLANVAKGRGGSLTWQVCDGPTPWGLEFCFPLRELYKSELDLYVKYTPELQGIVIPDKQTSENLSTRDLSIDALMNQYIATQGEKYPGVMANVVRTVNKLQPERRAIGDTRCSLCAASLQHDTLSAEREDNAERICYACLRSRDDMNTVSNT
ncbi:hypothetical protein BGW36DRAFT_297951 [Talaromyces proteolyticus]|uniref:Cytoplasmic tRNA 2-thiolation protein 2 n=1 Tax=Talaromyces proteolyticus TaxID=1131652 RepID=A0AAD4KU87_9EURO|nr:uncharacterized protein BGW36DRAFT_297951 [Talaromyces proteolyticus]KAH8696164.1 hypothetical protein BGW36DRAFT_297951 [Talaromyces proteolyticus]